MTPAPRRFGSVFFAALLFVATGPTAGAQNPPSVSSDSPATTTCTAVTSPVEINIANPQGDVVYDSGVSRNDLVRIQKSRSRGMQGNLKPLGLTLSDFTFSIGSSVRLQPAAGNKFCAYPGSFDITIGYSGFKVYIDRRYGKGSCEYQAILDHENTHVALYRRNLLHSLPNLQRAAYSAARRIAPMIVDTPQQGALYIQRQMEKSLTPHVARLSRGADVANARIDTMVSYKQVQGRCRNW